MITQNLNLALSTNLVELLPGQSAEVTVTVTNYSSEVERYQLVLGQLEAGWGQLDRTEMLLYPEPPGNEGRALLRLNVPPNAIPGNYSPLIQIFLTDEPGVLAASLPFTLLVGDTVGQEMGLVEPVLHTKLKTAQFQVRLNNKQHRPATMRLAAQAAQPRVRVTLLPPIVDVPAYTELVGRLEMILPRYNWVGRDRSYTFKLTADSLPGQVEGQLIQTCRWPWLRRILTTPWLLALLIVIPLLLIGLIIALVILLQPSPPPQRVPITGAAMSCTLPNPNQQVRLATRGNFTDVLVSNRDGTNLRSIQSEPAEVLPSLFGSLAAISPDGSTVAYVTANNEALDNAIIYIAKTGAGAQNRQLITPVPVGLWPNRLAWSPDNASLSYVVRNGGALDLYTVSINERKPHKVPLDTQKIAIKPEAFYGDNEFGALCWSTDASRLIVGASNERNVQQIEVAVNDGSPRSIDKPANQTDYLTALKNASQNHPNLAPLGDSNCAVPTFSQNDPQWQDKVMQTGTEKIGQAGCALTAAAMLLNFYKVPTDPNGLNVCLAEQANPFDWRLTVQKCAVGQASGGDKRDFRWDDLNSVLSQGQPAIVGLVGGATGSHYLVVLGGYDSLADTYRVNDPWDGSNYKSLGTFLAMGYKLRWLVSFSGPNAPSCPVRFDAIAKSQNNFSFKVTSPEDGGLYNQSVPLNFQSEAANYSAQLYTLVDGANLNPTAAATAEVPVKPVENGTSVGDEGAYELVLDTGATNSNRSLLAVHFTIDRTPPTIEVDRPEGVFETSTVATSTLTARRPVSLKFKASDNLSGVASIQYKVNGSDWKSYTNDVAARAIVFDRPDTYTVVYRATDTAGNVSSEQSFSFTYSPVASDTNLQAVLQATPTPTLVPTPTPEPEGPPTPTPIPAAQIVAAPPLLVFDAKTDSLNVQLTNTGGQQGVWSVAPLSDPAASYLKIGLAGGSIAPNGGATVPVQVSQSNVSGAQINTGFDIVYNNGGGRISVLVSIVPQNPPTVQFVSPTAGPLMTTTVPIKIAVTAAGAAKPNHATFFARYSDVVGGPSTNHTIPGSASEATGWQLNWDVSGLPPQSGIDLSGFICWSADESNCLKMSSGVAGLSLAKPSATITLDPDSPKLTGLVTLSAKVSGGIDHISYVYNYIDGGKPATGTLDRASLANGFITKWDTTLLQPQTGITLKALVCWGSDDNPATCTAPANALPPSFAVDPPAVTVAPLAPADIASLPVTLTLGGTINKAYNPNVAVLVNYKYLPTNPGGSVGAVVERNDIATLSPIVGGVGTWLLSVDTSAWPPQSVTFTPKICWDGNPTGSFCYAAPTTVAGTIPDFSVQFTPPNPPDLSKPVTLKATATPATRLASVRLLVSYSTFAGTTKNDVVLATATPDTGFAFSLDSVALGLKPNQDVGLKLVACTSVGYCTPTPPTPLLTLNVPKTNFAFVPNPSPLTVLLPTVAVKATVTGRGVSSLSVSSFYQRPFGGAIITSTVQTFPAPIAADGSVDISWNTTAIAPQNNVKLGYRACWGQGLLDSGCLEGDALTGLSIPAPSVSKIYLNTGLEYTSTAPMPVGVDSAKLTGGGLGKISFPLEAMISGTNVTAVRWRASAGTFNSEIAVPNVDATSKLAKTIITLDLDAIRAKADLSSEAIILTGSPIWGGDSEYTDTANVKKFAVKLVGLRLEMQQGSTYVTVAPGSVPLTNQAMLKQSTQFRFVPTDSSLIKRFIPSLSYQLPSPAYNLPLADSGGAAKEVVLSSGGQWLLNWNHSTDTPRLAPQGDISLNWRLCNTPGGDNSGCWPTSFSGGFNSAGGLILGAVRFSPTGNPDLPLFSPGAYFNSSFNATVEIGAAGIAKQVRFYAYPTSRPDPGNRVQLLTRPNPTVSGNSWKLQVYWPDDSSLPVGAPTVANLLANTLDNKISIGVQYCTDANPDIAYNDARCTDWDGQVMQTIDPGWRATINALQSCIVTWQPYAGGDPYDSYLQDGGTTTRTLSVRVLPVGATTIINSVNFFYIVGGGSKLVIGRGDLQLDGVTYNFDWKVGSVSLPRDSSTSRSVELVASVGTSVTPIASDGRVLTHGSR